MKEYAVIFSHSNNVGLDGYEDLNPDDPRTISKAVFKTRHEADVYRNLRELANPTTRFTVCEIDV